MSDTVHSVALAAEGQRDQSPHPHVRQGETVVPTAAPNPVEQRDAFFDNGKYLAIVLVAAWHAWEPLREGSRAVTAPYTLVYAFHMPAFTVIAGYFSRTFDVGPGRIKRLVTGVAVPYVVFEVAYTLSTRWTDQEPKSGRIQKARSWGAVLKGRLPERCDQRADLAMAGDLGVRPLVRPCSRRRPYPRPHPPAGAGSRASLRHHPDELAVRRAPGQRTARLGRWLDVSARAPSLRPGC
jgi:hypothetical protein